MKRIIALVLSLVMMLTLFAGLNVSATNTEDGSVLVLDPGKSAVIANRTFTTAYTSGDTAAGVKKIQSAEFAGVGFEGGVLFDSAERAGCSLPVTDSYGNGGMNITITPNVTINPNVDKFALYLKLPKKTSDYTKLVDWWDYLPISWKTITVTQNGKNYSSGFTGAKMSYLSKDASSWTSGSFTSSGTCGLSMDNFEGYVMIDLTTLPKVADWTDFDWTKEYSVKSFEVQTRHFGGDLGSFGIGGWYGVTVDSTAIQAQIKGVPVTHNLTSYDPNPLLGSSNVDFGYGYGLWNTSFASGTESYDTTVNSIAALSNSKGAKNSVKFSAPTANGYLTEQSTEFYLNCKLNTEDGSSKGMFYFELPETGLGYNSIKITQAIYSYGSGTQRYGNLSGHTFKYLSVDSGVWVTSTFTSDMEMILPDGFKGFVMIDFNHYNDSTDTNKTLFRIHYQFGMYGGDYGNAYLGGVYEITKDNDSIWLKSGNNVYKLSEATTVAPIRGSLYFPETDNSKLGTTATSSAFVVTTDAEYTAVFTKNSEAIGNHLMRKFNSETAIGSKLGKSFKLKFNPWLTVNPDVNAVMAWMEFPKTPDGSDLQVKMDNPSFQQNGQWYWTNSRRLQYSYLAYNSDKWVNGQVIDNDNKIFTIPSGFKGYVKFNFDTANNYREGWGNPNDGTYGKRLFNYEADYVFTDFTFDFQYFGGEYGAFTVGAWYILSYDSTSKYAVISNSGTAVNGKPEPLTLLADENAVMLNKVIENIETIGEVTLEDVALIEETIDLYNGLDDKYKRMFTEEQVAAYSAMVTSYAKYRPAFGGVAAFKPDGSGYAGMKISASLNASAAIAEGYYVTEYGTVYLKENNFNALKTKFDANTTGAIVESNTNADNATADFAWKSTIKTNNVANFGLDYYFRAYVVYSNGADSVTVWNSDYENTALYTNNEVTPEDAMAAGRLPIQTIKTTNPYLVTSLAGAANKFGFSIMGGSMVGNVDGIFELGTYSNGWQHYVIESIKSSDLVAARKHLLGTKTLKYWYTADMNGDEIVDIRDLVKLKKQVAGSVADATEELTNVLANGGTVVLSDDVKLDTQYKIAEGTDVVIDLNGKTLTLDYADNYALNVKGSLTIKGNGNIKIKGFGLATGYNSNGLITIDGGTFTAKGCDYILGCFGGEIIINDGVFNGEYCVVNNFSDYYGVEGTVTINGGTFTAEEPILGSPVVDNRA